MVKREAEEKSLEVRVIEALHRNRTLIMQAHTLKIKSTRLGRQIRSAENSTMDPQKWAIVEIEKKKEIYLNLYTLRRLKRENRLLILMIRKKMNSRTKLKFGKRKPLGKSRHRGR